MNAQASPPELERVVGDGDVGCRLDVFLARQPEVGSRSLAKALITDGHARVDGKRAKPGLGLVEGQRVRFRVVLPDAEPDARGPAPRLRVLHEDPYLLVIDKPPGLPVHPPETGRKVTEYDIAHLVQAHAGPLPTISGEDRPGIVHRLDKDTTGVLLIPKTDESFLFVQSQFKARTIEKEYRAICYGDPRYDSDWVEANIAVHPKKDRMTVSAEGGKEAATYWEALERFGDLVFMRCKPRTGRTHQIRVHMTSIGHPIVADRLYRRHRAHDELPSGAPEPGRQCLHAYRVRLRHPRTHEEMIFEAPIPDDMQRLLNWLRARR